MSDATRRTFCEIRNAASRSIVRLVELHGHHAKPMAWLHFFKEVEHGTVERGSVFLTRAEARELQKALAEFIRISGDCRGCHGRGVCREWHGYDNYSYESCKRCNGAGDEPPPAPPPCQTCHGKGVVRYRGRKGIGVDWLSRDCQECKK